VRSSISKPWLHHCSNTNKFPTETNLTVDIHIMQLYYKAAKFNLHSQQ